MRLKIRVTGIVQGVGFRPFIYRTARRNALTGYVQNRGDAGVDILVEGREQDIKNFLRDLKDKKPPLAQIYDVITSPMKGKQERRRFTILKSSDATELSGSVIPPDVAICDECLDELRDPKNPRHEFFFITCTDCGPRYTIIDRLPYDRKNTTMSAFQICSFCSDEYENPQKRRFHAQTVACPECGPSVSLTNNGGERVAACRNPIREAGRLISEGHIVAIKGYGGFHVAASTVMDEPLVRLRKVKHRREKPFSVMAAGLRAIETFAEVKERDRQLLTSPARPIVLLDKSEDYYLSDLISPRLHNVGVMLPYTGLHYILFSDVGDPAFVMTSANPPNQPIIKDDEEALEKLSGVVDYFLFHNRQITHRCDDSVVRVHDRKQAFIRRSRGYAPAPVFLRKKTERCAVGLGGELNNTACVVLGGKAFISQHIGDVENVETCGFLENAAKHLIRLTNAKVETIGYDLHPRFATTQLARELAEANSWELIQVQHHYAHAAALMAEHGVDELVGICCDGYGYGLDGEAWGGEVLFCSQASEGFERLAHLEKQPLIGGDLATRYPLRVAAGILHGEVDVETWLQENQERFPHGEREVRVILNQLERHDSAVKTTSCGRILDAIAAVLGICYERTYEGEPAMKLESLALKGKDVLGLEPEFKNNVLHTKGLVRAVFENRDEISKANLAHSVHAYLAKGLATLAIEKASEKGVSSVGFTGGVACNEIMTQTLRSIIEASGLDFLVHEAVPPGDGGVSFGQAVVASF